MNTKIAVPSLVLLTAAGAFWVRGSLQADSQTVPTPAPVQAAQVVEIPAAFTSTDPEHRNHMMVYKGPACGCCDGWVEHLREAGFHVEVEEHPRIHAIKAQLGVPGELSSCHTAVIAGRVLEGHIPADAIRRFLEESPEGAVGLTVPGMPIGSPGMEVEGRAADAYDILTFDAAGRSAVFERR